MTFFCIFSQVKIWGKIPIHLQFLTMPKMLYRISSAENIPLALRSIESLLASYGWSLLGISSTEGMGTTCASKMWRIISAMFWLMRIMEMSLREAKPLNASSISLTLVFLSTTRKLGILCLFNSPINNICSQSYKKSYFDFNKSFTKVILSYNLWLDLYEIDRVSQNKSSSSTSIKYL